MAKGPSPAQNAQNMAALNALRRSQLLASAPYFRKNLGTVTGQIGQTVRQKLFNVGVTTKLRLYVSAAITIGVANATVSPKAPWNLINRVRLTDYDGTDRVNLSGFQLFVLNCVRQRELYGYNFSAGPSSNAAVFTNPAYPVATGNQTVSFFVDVPLAFDVDNSIVQLQDLRGAILSQTAVGDMYLNVDWNTSYIGDADSLYVSGGGTTVVANGANNISLTTFQEYFLPQAVDSAGTVPLPPIDLQTVYELAGNVRSQDNIAANTEKLMNYPNVRSVVGAYFNYVTNGAMAQGNINRLRLIANGNNVMIDNTELAQLFEQRELLDAPGDIGPGVYFRSHRQKPIETALYGNVQMGLTINTATGGNQYVEQAYESFYTKGIALPGLTQAQ